MFRGAVSGSAAAVKIYFPGQVHKRVDREVTLLSSLQSPSIARPLWSGHVTTRTETLAVVATELVSGTPLTVSIANRSLGPAEIGLLVHDVASAIDAMWEHRVVHRDLKPSNIILTDQGRACVIDLGLARHVDRSPLTGPGSTWGTYGYLSPEQSRATRQLTCKSDVFTLGIIALEAFIGGHPTGRDQAALLEASYHVNLPPEVSSWEHQATLARMLHPRPTMRPMPMDLVDEFARYVNPDQARG